MPATVQTVLGRIDPEELGLTLAHEHLFVRLVDGWFVEPKDPEEARFASEKFSLANISRVRRRPWSNRDNCVIDDFDTVIGEVGNFARAGGGAIVELTPANLGRDPIRMRQVSETTGVPVIAGCGYYVESSHSPEVRAMSAGAMADLLEGELTDGIGDTGVRPGVIGEIGTGNPVMPGERKVLEASAIVQQRTGVPISVHLFPAGGTAREVLDILEKAGADLTKVALGHLDCQDPIPTRDYLDLATRGSYLVYDQFGASWASDELREFYAGRLYWSPPASDQARVRSIAELVEAGYGDQVMIAHDVCSKLQQTVWGGQGFAHIPQDMRPFFGFNGFSEDELDGILCRNPQRWLAWG
jgi:phosphotriesterase-related protein